MSRGVPVACTRAGGNPELANPAFLFGRRDAAGIAAALERLAEPEARAAEACRSFEAARAFDSQALDRARKDFYQAFVHEEDQNPCAD